MENIWITSEKSPNDPFDHGMTDGQADRLKRIPELEDETIKVQFEKLDAPPGLTRNVLEMTKKNAEGKTEKIAEESILTSEYSYDQVEQALLVL